MALTAPKLAGWSHAEGGSKLLTLAFPAVPTGTKEGDWLLALVLMESDETTTGTATKPTGWLTVGTVAKTTAASDEQASESFLIEYKGAAMPTITVSKSSAIAVHLLRIETSAGLDLSTGWTARTTSATETEFSTVTTTAEEDMVLLIALNCDGQSYEAAPAGWTAYLAKGGLEQPITIGVYYKIQKTAGASGTAKAAQSAAGQKTVITIALKGKALTVKESVTWGESVKATDTWKRVHTAPRAMPETVKAADTWGRVHTAPRAVSETVKAADSWARSKNAPRKWSETVTATDTWKRVHAAPRSIAETLKAADVWTRGHLLVKRTWAESVSAADGWKRVHTAPRAWSESVKAADSWGDFKSFVRGWSESVKAADAWTRGHLVVKRTWAESVAAADSWKRVHTAPRAWVESVSAADTWKRFVTRPRAWAESVKASDAWARGHLVVSRSWAESVKAADTWARKKAAPRAWSESVKAADTWVRLKSVARSWAESVKAADAWKRVHTAPRAWSEAVKAADTWARKHTAPRAWAEALKAVDTWARGHLVVKRTWAESVAAADSWKRTHTAPRKWAESVKATDSWTRKFTASRAMSTTVGVASEFTYHFSRAVHSHLPTLARLLLLQSAHAAIKSYSSTAAIKQYSASVIMAPYVVRNITVNGDKTTVAVTSTGNTKLAAIHEANKDVAILV